MTYKPRKIKKGPMYKTIYEDNSTTTVYSQKKAAARDEINTSVFDLEDAHADTAKWLSLVTTLLSRLYTAMDTETKNRLDPQDRAMIEYTFAKFAVTYTRGDIAFAKEGLALIDKLLKRQNEVGKIVDK
jgi:hypothetical protein